MDARIKTDRLLLRYVTPDDVEAIQPIICDPRVYENVASIPPNQPRSATQDWISHHADARAAQTDYVYAITSDRTLIGLMGLHRAGAADVFELGYWLAPNAWGNGFATEAGRAVISNLETNLGAQKTVSGYFRGNPASGRVLEKLGYRKIGEGQKYCAGRDATLPHILVKRTAAFQS